MKHRHLRRNLRTEVRTIREAVKRKYGINVVYVEHT